MSFASFVPMVLLHPDASNAHPQSNNSAATGMSKHYSTACYVYQTAKIADHDYTALVARPRILTVDTGHW